MKKNHSLLSGGRRPKGRGGRFLSDHGGPILLGAMAVAVLTLGGTWVNSMGDLIRSRTVDPQFLCPVGRPSPETVVLMVDQTDPLAQTNQRRVKALVERLRDDLGRGERLVIVPFDGDLSKPLDPVFNVCSPGHGDEADGRMESARHVQAQFDARFGAPLDAVIAGLATGASSDRSPIAEQIERVATDPALGWSGRRRLIVATDGLQNGAVSVYSGTTRLPKPRAEFLDGFEVEFFPLENPRDHALQTPQLERAWQEWTVAAGGEPPP